MMMVNAREGVAQDVRVRDHVHLRMRMTEWSKSFREAYCERYRCPPARFETVAARKALPLFVRFLRPFILILDPGHFQLDFELMQQVGDARSWSEVNAVLGAFKSNNKLRGGFWRNTVKWRASGRRVSHLVRRLKGEPPRHAG